eukprot:TRINITY_DN41260_c0_g1_i1.p1 TRINITY_DN41260_c0_g1~~TRINITY_DN41260_c0_g1_i1.p1  ORF type:complete len:442 (+),score=126.80 TRINITY_DN41260_c0_g1_i1:153-1478(+)
MMSSRHVLLAIWATLQLSADATSLRAGRSAASDSSDGSCSCECCNVASRRPDERVANTGVKCAPSEERASTCGTECQPANEDPILGLIAKDSVVDYSRFCFYECKPSEGPKASLSTQCLAFEEEEAKHIPDQDGNPMDPAAFYSPGGIAALLQQQKAQVKAAEKPPIDPEVAKKAAADGRTAVQETLAGPASSDALNAIRDGEAMNRVPGQLFAQDPLAEAGLINKISQKTEEASNSAKKYADAAVEALKAGRDENWRAAMFTANKQLRFLKDMDHEMFMLATARGPTPWRVLAATNARAAARPFLEAAKGAQRGSIQNREAALDMQKQAKDLEQEAMEIKEKADILRRTQQTDEADMLDMQAGDVTKKARGLLESAKAQLASSKAQDARAELYYGQAKQAAYAGAQNTKLPTRAQYVEPLDPLRHWQPTASDPDAYFTPK